MAEYQSPYTILTNQAATGHSKIILSRGFRNIVVQVGGNATANMTIKFKGGYGDSAPNFTAARSETNRWDYMEVVDSQDGSLIDGDSGVIIGNSDNRVFEYNTNHVDWVAVEVSSYTAGQITATLQLSTDARK